MLVVSAGFIVKTLGISSLELGLGDVVPIVYNCVLPLGLPDKLGSMSLEEAEQAVDTPKPEVLFSHMLVLASPTGNKRSTMRLFVRHKILKHHYFDQLINFVILANIVTMAATDYEAVGSGAPSQLNKVLAQCEMGWLFVFSAELVLKVYALGLVGIDSYLGDAWNRLDGLLVALGILDYLPFPFVNLTAFRMLRALRALRLMSHNEEMKILLAAIINAMAQTIQAGGGA